MSGPNNKIMDEFKKFLKTHKVDSIEEANKILAKLSFEHNNSGLPEFLGLSPEQMSNILYNDFENGIFLTINSDSDSLVNEVPIIKQALYILKIISESQQIKLTEKGFFPKLLVQEFWSQFIQEEIRFKPSREADCLEAIRLRIILVSSGLVKVRNKKMSLTKKGGEILKAQDLNSLYQGLFKSFVNDWNWASEDRYPEFELIQMAALFSFFMLKTELKGATSVKEIGSRFIKVFPKVLNEENRSFFDSPEESFLRCFGVRFLNRVCIPLGVLEQIGKPESYFSDLNDQYKLSDFFSSAFLFNENFEC